ncbi:MAG: energy transducer TonB [Cyclonatronaceae bacterium]
MKAKNDTYRHSETAYRHRIGYSIAAVQILAILLFRFLPAIQPGETDLVLSERVFERDIELIEPTRQGRLLPAPPRPSMLPPVPTDVILDDEIIEIEEPRITGNDLDQSTTGEPGPPVENPDQPPSVIRIVEAITPGEVRRDNTRLEVAVRFLISSEGDVKDATIIRVRKMDRNGDGFTEIPIFEYNITDAISRAAMQWRFRPARHEGISVPAYSTHFFTLGG